MRLPGMVRKGIKACGADDGDQLLDDGEAEGELLSGEKHRKVARKNWTSQYECTVSRGAFAEVPKTLGCVYDCFMC